MADIEDKAAGSLTIADALDMYEHYNSFWSENYSESNIDLKMAAGDPATHWGAAYQDRMRDKQLTMVINQLPQFIHQVTNDIRQNTPSVDTIPDSEGDIETAQVYSDLIRDIEYKSAADEAYDTGAEYAVKCAIGFIRVDHDYCNDDSEEQELQIKKVHDPLSVWIDPSSVECDGRDANGAICLELISKKKFEDLYPGKEFISFTDPKNKDEKEIITIAEIFVREFTGKRKKKPIVYRYKFSGKERLAATTFPGDYVPVVPVIGEDVWINGKRILASLIRQARDAQLRLNHWACKEQQILNMAPIAPVMAEEGTLINDRGQWQKPGSEMVLEYKKTDLDGNPANKPERLQPPPIPTGILNAMEGAKQNIKESLGMYNASIGEKSNETSGIAIERRQREGDVATFHFPDNVRRSITQVGRILASAIPIIYDTPRIIQTMSNENEPRMVGINGGPLQDNQKKHHHLTRGKYHVRVTTGASYTTKRQEEAAFLQEAIKAVPELMNIGGDLLFKSLDTPGAQAMSARMKKMLPPQLQDDQADQDPQKMQMQAEIQKMQAIIQQGAQQIQQLQAELDNKQGENQVNALELQVKQQELIVKQQELQVKMAELQQAPEQSPDDDIDLAQVHDQTIKEREMALKEAEFNLKVLKETGSEGGQEMGNADESIEMLQAKIQQKMAEKEAAEQQAIMQQQAQMEAQQMEMQEKEERRMQQAALMQGLAGIQQSIGALILAIQTPKSVVRGPDGLIQGIQ